MNLLATFKRASLLFTFLLLSSLPIFASFLLHASPSYTYSSSESTPLSFYSFSFLSSSSSSSSLRRNVFSGIVEEMGTVKSMDLKEDMEMWDGSVASGYELTVKDVKVALSEGSAYEGCSIAINGVCLTVKKYKQETLDEFTVGVSPETIERTNLIDLKANAPVNLERALPANGRNSGHYVQGHVDGTGTIIKKWNEGDALWFQIQILPELIPFIVEKGFIAVDGTSLTVCDVNETEGWFTLMLIPYTQQHIILPSKSTGERVNIEVDVMGKYVLRSVETLTSRITALEKEIQGLKEK